MRRVSGVCIHVRWDVIDVQGIGVIVEPDFHNGIL